jgi:hypothetical protein
MSSLAMSMPLMMPMRLAMLMPLTMKTLIIMKALVDRAVTGNEPELPRGLELAGAVRMIACSAAATRMTAGVTEVGEGSSGDGDGGELGVGERVKLEDQV